METSLLNNNTSGTSSNTTNPLANGSDTSKMFTELLVAQIRNQDPLSPTDPAQFVNQLTQLSQTEALQSLSTLTSNNTSLLQSMQILSLGAQVGSEVLVDTDTVKLDTSTVKGEFQLEASSSKTTLVLTGSDGVKHEVELGSRAPGAIPFSVDPVALGLPPGTYKLSVVTSTTEKPADIAIAGRLNSVRLTSGGAVVNVGNVGEVVPAAITAFNGKAASATSNS